MLDGAFSCDQLGRIVTNSTSSAIYRSAAVRGVFMVAPPLAALCYPFLLQAFHAAVTSSFDGHAFLSALLLISAMTVPLIGVYACARLGAANLTAGALNAKRVALFAIGAPPIYVAMGVLLTMARAPVTDNTVWIVLWGLATALATKSMLAPGVLLAAPTREVSARLRAAHGFSAAAIVLLFLAMHLFNHLAGLVSESMHRLLMSKFEVVYRANVIEPLVAALFLFQVASGASLLWNYTRRSADLYRSLQIATGAYLFFYVLGHMDSVFIYARMFAHIKTDWNFATGAPAGLIMDAWNIRLLPHYAIGVFFVLTHLVLGMRIVALHHNVDTTRANTLTNAGIGISAAIAAVIMIGMSGIHMR